MKVYHKTTIHRSVTNADSILWNEFIFVLTVEVYFNKCTSSFSKCFTLSNLVSLYKNLKI